VAIAADECGVERGFTAFGVATFFGPESNSLPGVIEFDDSIDLSIPTLSASLPASPEETSYLLRIKSVG